MDAEQIYHELRYAAEEHSGLEISGAADDLLAQAANQIADDNEPEPEPGGMTPVQVALLSMMRNAMGKRNVKGETIYDLLAVYTNPDHINRFADAMDAAIEAYHGEEAE